MLSITDCFKAAREVFIQKNRVLIEQINQSAAAHAENIGVSEEELTETELNKHFSQYLLGLGLGDDVAVIAIRLMAPSTQIRQELLLEYYTTVADHLGITIEEFFSSKRMSATDL